MSGDPKVLAGLQQAFNASDDPRIHRLIGNAWEFETASCSTIYPALGDRIRAWAPPDEPSLEQRVAELETKFNKWRNLQIADAQYFNGRIDALEQHPDLTAPDDPVCARIGCGHSRSYHINGGKCVCCPENRCLQFFPNPAPAAADLDPMRVEAAARALFEACYLDRSGRGSGMKWEDIPDYHQDWRDNATAGIRAYLNGETR